MNDNEIDRIAASVNALRPDWPVPSLRTLIASRLTHRTRRDVAVALTWVACDSATKTPARVLESGPWWQAVTSGDGKSTTPRPPRADEECRTHAGQWADRCHGCAADQLAGTPTPKRTTAQPAPDHYRAARLALKGRTE